MKKILKTIKICWRVLFLPMIAVGFVISFIAISLSQGISNGLIFWKEHF